MWYDVKKKGLKEKKKRRILLLNHTHICIVVAVIAFMLQKIFIRIYEATTKDVGEEWRGM